MRQTMYFFFFEQLEVISELSSKATLPGALGLGPKQRYLCIKGHFCHEIMMIIPYLFGYKTGFSPF